MGDFLKKILDFIGALILIIALSPLLVIIWIMVRVKIGGPVVFRQTRPGKNGEIFTLYKFRSMTNEKDSEGKLLSDEHRLTKFGSFLRSSSLDELPELFNILFGHMSFVGPRPLLVQYLDRYTPEQMRRHEVRPGLTGWAQVNGRNALSWEEKFKMDIWYVDHKSFWLDIKILYMTFKVVLKRSGIHADGETTMHEFMGSKED